jgi:tRNA (adenine22-N1)-methyltransferase
MNLPLSERLRICAGFVAKGERVADIGCDHGYLGIYLLQNDIASTMIEADINEGPLQSALHNAHKYGVADKMRFYLSDGVKNIPRDFDTLVCAGMGGDTMIHILEDAPWLKDRKYRLVLQCQSKTPMLRQYLSEHGWRITEESVLRDGKFLYTVMEVYYEPEYPRLTRGECYFPPALLENPGEALPEYFSRIVEGLRLSVKYQDDPEKKAVLEELDALAQDKNLRFLTEECQ